MASSVIKNTFVASKNVSKTIKVPVTASRVEVSIYGKILVVSYFFVFPNEIAKGTELVTMDLQSDLLATAFDGGDTNLNNRSIYAERDLSANTNHFGQLVGVLV